MLYSVATRATTVGICRAACVGRYCRTRAAAIGIDRHPIVAKPRGATGGGPAREQTIRIEAAPGLAPEAGESSPNLPEDSPDLLGHGWAGMMGGAAPKLGGGGPRAEEGPSQDESGGGAAERQTGHEGGSFSRRRHPPRPSGPGRRLTGSMLPPGVPEITPKNAGAVQTEEKIRMPSRDNPEDLKFVVVFLRLLRGWTQTELAEAAGLSASAISRYEIGDIVPGREALEEIATAVGLPLRMLDRVFLWVGAARSALASADRAGRSGPAGSGHRRRAGRRALGPPGHRHVHDTRQPSGPRHRPRGNPPCPLTRTTARRRRSCGRA